MHAQLVIWLLQLHDTLYKYRLRHSTKCTIQDNQHSTTVDYEHCWVRKLSWFFKDTFLWLGAAMDYDGNGVVEDVQTEVKGCLNKLYHLLPLNADTTLNYSLINTVNLRKAYWNYQLILNDGSLVCTMPSLLLMYLQKQWMHLATHYQ